MKEEQTEDILVCGTTGKEYRGKYALRNFRISAAKKGYPKDGFTKETRPIQTYRA